MLNPKKLKGYNNIDIIINHQEWSKFWIYNKLIRIKKGVWSFTYQLLFVDKTYDDNKYICYENRNNFKRIYIEIY